MNEVLLKELESVLTTLNRIDTFQLDAPDFHRLSSAKRLLKEQIDFVRTMTEEQAA